MKCGIRTHYQPEDVYHRPPGGVSYLDQYRRVAAGQVRLVRLNYTEHLEGLS